MDQAVELKLRALKVHVRFGPGHKLAAGVDHKVAAGIKGALYFRDS